MTHNVKKRVPEESSGECRGHEIRLNVIESNELDEGGRMKSQLKESVLKISVGDISSLIALYWVLFDHRDDVEISTKNLD